VVKVKSVGQEREVMGQKWMQDCDQQVLVTHRACAAKVLGTELAARATANGDRLTMASSRVFGSTDALYLKPASSPIQSFVPIFNRVSMPPIKAVRERLLQWAFAPIGNSPEDFTGDFPSLLMRRGVRRCAMQALS